jgi:Tfp pilus assembly protein PilN
MFFSDTRVESLREYVPTAVSETSDGHINTSFLLATGAALRLSNDDLYQGSFDAINLLPRKLLRRKVSLPVTWHVMALYGLIFASALFWVARYFSNESKERQHRQKIAQYAPEYANADPAVLKSRVDSLNQVTSGYMRALQVLDSLLVGSDVWSRSLETASREVSEARGIWIDNWRPQGNRLVLSGNATSRDRIVELARRTESDIESVTFSEIREWPVYTYVMKMPIRNTLPEAAKYLREQVRMLSEEQARQTTTVATTQ